MYDVAIIGGGPAGMTAGIYAGRAGHKAIIFEMGVPGGQAATTDHIENYPGFPGGVSGSELMMKFYEQTQEFGVEMRFEMVTNLDVDGDVKVITTNKETYEARSVIIATGANPKTLGLPNEGKFRGRGVSYCATCDGFFFKDKEVAVIGGGDAAVEEALYLTKMCSKVTLFHRRDELRANKVSQERAKANPKIEIAYNTIPIDILGEDKVSGLKTRDVVTGEEKVWNLEGIFIFVGYQPANEAFPENLKVHDKAGYVITDTVLNTNIPGVFAIGDVVLKSTRQVSTAVGDGGLVMHTVDHYLDKDLIY